MKRDKDAWYVQDTYCLWYIHVLCINLHFLNNFKREKALFTHCSYLDGTYFKDSLTDLKIYV